MEAIQLIVQKLMDAYKQEKFLVLEEKELKDIMSFIVTSPKEDVVYLWFWCVKSLDPKNKTFLDEYCTPFVVKAVYT